MPKETILIEQFDGMIGSTDMGDLPDTVSPEVDFVDIRKTKGALQGAKDPVSTGVSVAGRAFTLYKDGTQAAYYDVVAGEIRILKNIGGTEAVVDPGIASAALNTGEVTGISDGRAVHFGLGSGGSNPPKWVGDVSHGQIWTGSAFVVAAAGADQILPAILKSKDSSGGNFVFTTIQSSTNATSEAGTVFSSEVRYRLYYSLVYDYLQESPLVFAGNAEPTSTYGWSQYTLRVTVESSGLAKRVTGVNMYWAEHPIGGEPGPIRYFKSIDLTLNSTTWTQGSPSTRYYRDFVETEYPTLGSTYEERTGVPSTLEHMEVHYGVSCAYGGFHYVARAYIQGAGTEVVNQVLRSKAYRYDTFEWSNDFVTLPVKPNALRGYEGRIYAFCDGITYVLSANLAIEDVIEGKGAFHNESVSVSDVGMFFAGEQGMFLLQAGDIAQPVGLDVLYGVRNNSTGYSANSGTFTAPVVCLYHAEQNAFICIFGTTTSDVRALIYHVDTGQWTFCFLSVPIANLRGGFVGIDGKPYYSVDTGLLEMFAGSVHPDWIWASKQFHDGGRPFIVYKMRMKCAVAPPTNMVGYYENGGGINNLTGANWTSLGGGVYEATVNTDSAAPWGRVRTFQIQIIGGATQIVYKIELVVRRLPVT